MFIARKGLRAHLFCPPITVLSLLLGLGVMPSAYARGASPEAVAELRTEIALLRAEQAENDRRLGRLEAMLQRIVDDSVAPDGIAAAAHPVPEHASSTRSSHAPDTTMPGAAPPLPGDAWASRLELSGDLRLRGQGDWSDKDGKNRGSMQLRARLGATFAVNDRVTVGARIATGDSNDPNSTDVQLSNWLDDLEVSLDQAYIQADFGSLTLYGGKMPQPFVRTDLVWDGDVNPQGVSGLWRKPLPSGSALRMSGLAFVVDEQAVGADSIMLGAQLGYESAKRGVWSFDVHGAYYHYDLGSTAGADEGDFRSNLRDVNGNYLSDFHLANLLFGVAWAGLGERWPLRLSGDYVYNAGAATDANTGYGADLTVGRVSAQGDWRFVYGYAMAQADAVLAAFSHDNLGFGTNYRAHALTIDYVPIPETMLSLYWYRYKPYSGLYPVGHDPGDWLDRLRLAFMVSF